MRALNLIAIGISFLCLSATARGFAQGHDTEVLELQAQMSESRYNSSKTDDRLSEFIGSYELLISSYCSAEALVSPYYKGDPKNPQCVKAIEHVLEFDGANPVALCARDGFSRRTCTETSAKQRYGTVDFSTGYWIAEDRSGSGKFETLNTAVAVVQKTNASKVAELRSKLYMLETWNQAQKHDQKTVDQLKSNINQGLKLACISSKVWLISPPQDNSASSQDSLLPKDDDFDHDLKVANASSARSKSPMGDILDRFESILPTPSPTPEPLIIKGPQHVRFRLVPAECADFIKKALLVDPLASAPVCLREGPFSPNCIDAKRREIERSTVSSTGSSKAGGNGFESF